MRVIGDRWELGGLRGGRGGLGDLRRRGSMLLSLLGWIILIRLPNDRYLDILENRGLRKGAKGANRGGVGDLEMRNKGRGGRMFKRGEEGGTIASVKYTPSIEISNIVKCGLRPRCKITSFIACVIPS